MHDGFMMKQKRLETIKSELLNYKQSKIKDYQLPPQYTQEFIVRKVDRKINECFMSKFQSFQFLFVQFFKRNSFTEGSDSQ